MRSRSLPSAFLGALLGATACASVAGLDDYGPASAGGAGGSTSNQGGEGGSAEGGGGTGGMPVGEPPAPTSCLEPAPGADASCGLDGGDDCCATILVPGGTFRRSHQFCSFQDPEYLEAEVSPFHLDKYEVTVGRFRAFVNAWSASDSPTPGMGAHEKVPGSGWQTSWPYPTKDDLTNLVDCTGSTWTDEPGANENLPINCVDWYAAFLFCHWDGGRLPTEAEWNYAAAGGDQQRLYPWGDDPQDSGDDLAVAPVCETCTAPAIAEVGSKPDGAGRWGHLDLSGNVAEWLIDASLIANQQFCVFESPCVDCIALGVEDDERHHRGGAFDAYYALRTDVRREASMGSTNQRRGLRCARPAQ